MFATSSPQRAFVFAAITIFFFLFSGVGITRAQTTTGCHPITATEIAGLKAHGVEIPSGGQFCDKERELLFGACAESPLPYLETKTTGSNVDVAHLNADFACRLSKFLQAADSAGMNIRIASAHRSVEHQRVLYAKYQREGGAPVAPPGRSRHNYGIAADLHFDGKWPSFGLGGGNTPRCIQTLPSCKWAHEQSGTFGLRYPMLVEPWHIEPGTQVKGMDKLPTDQNYWISDEGRTYAGAPAPAAPTSGFTNQIRQALGVSPQSSAAPVSQPSQTNTAQPSQLCSPSFTCSNNAMYYQSSTCTREIYQQCPYGCAGNACAASSTSPTSSVIGGAFGSSTAATSSDTSADDEQDPLDAISSYLGTFSATAVDIGTGTPLTLALGTIRDIAGISDNISLGGLAASSSVIISSVQPTSSQQTFTSSDLSGNLPYSPSAGSYTGFQSALAQMRASLEWAIQYLKPFGGFDGRR